MKDVWGICFGIVLLAFAYTETILTWLADEKIVRPAFPYSIHLILRFSLHTISTESKAIPTPTPNDSSIQAPMILRSHCQHLNSCHGSLRCMYRMVLLYKRPQRTKRIPGFIQTSETQNEDARSSHALQLFQVPTGTARLPNTAHKRQSHAPVKPVHAQLHGR
jgi:hypothetical protein